MASGTLIGKIKEDFKPAPLNHKEQRILNEVYARFEAANAEPRDKIHILKKYIGAREFHAFGGQESQEIELRACERIYLENF